MYDLQAEGLTASQKDRLDKQFAGIEEGIPFRVPTKIDLEFDMPPEKVQYETSIIDMYEYKETQQKQASFDSQQATYVLDKLKDILTYKVRDGERGKRN